MLTFEALAMMFSVSYFVNGENNKTHEQGLLCHIDERLTDKQRAELLSYDNVELTQVHHRYAPEIVKDCVFLINEQL
jgi:hypothetical protein